MSDRVLDKKWTTDTHGQPAPFTEEDLNRRIDELCGCGGCGGKFKCDCVSVFSQARRDLWYRTNTGHWPSDPS